MKILYQFKNMWVKKVGGDAEHQIGLPSWITLLLSGASWLFGAIWKTIKLVLVWCIILVYALMGVFFVVAVYKSIFG